LLFFLYQSNSLAGAALTPLAAAVATRDSAAADAAAVRPSLARRASRRSRRSKRRSVTTPLFAKRAGSVVVVAMSGVSQLRRVWSFIVAMSIVQLSSGNDAAAAQRRESSSGAVGFYQSSAQGLSLTRLTGQFTDKPTRGQSTLGLLNSPTAIFLKSR